jgi:hypothetical protein
MINYFSVINNLKMENGVYSVNILLSSVKPSRCINRGVDKLQFLDIDQLGFTNSNSGVLMT